MTTILITPAGGVPTADAPMCSFLLHLAHDPNAFVGEIQAPVADLTGRDWLIERHLEGSGCAVAGPLERTGDDQWRVDVVPA